MPLGYLYNLNNVLSYHFVGSKTIQIYRVLVDPHGKLHLGKVGVNLPGVGSQGHLNTNDVTIIGKDRKGRFPQANLLYYIPIRNRAQRNLNTRNRRYDSLYTSLEYVR